MPTSARKFPSSYSANKYVNGTMSRESVRVGSIDAVPTWMFLVGVVAAMIGVAVIYITW